MPKTTVEMLEDLKLRGCTVLIGNDHHVEGPDGKPKWDSPKGWWVKIEGTHMRTTLKAEATFLTLDQSVNAAYHRFIGFAAHGNREMAAVTYVPSDDETDNIEVQF